MVQCHDHGPFHYRNRSHRRVNVVVSGLVNNVPRGAASGFPMESYREIRYCVVAASCRAVRLIKCHIIIISRLEKMVIFVRVGPHRALTVIAQPDDIQSERFRSGL